MGLHKIKSKAVRYNGFTDGMVVPTGQFKESGVNLLRPTYAGGASTTKSDATKIGRLHLPTETNPLNRILGPFTIDAFIVPNYGGTVVVKPKCFELKVGHPFKNAPIEFSIHCVGRVFTLSTAFDVNTLRESHSGTYGGGEHLPDDISEGAQPLMLVTAQFTGDEMRIYVNTNLVASLNLVEQRILDNVSSDMYIGGRGGEYRGIIESIRIERGVNSPILQPLTVTDQTVGLWDFEDEIDIPDLHFFNNKNESSNTQGRDGTLDETGLLEKPLVFLGYAFQNIGDLGYFRIYDKPEHPDSNEDAYSALEKLASLATGIPLEDIKRQTWYSTSLNLNAYTYGTNTGSLDYLTSGRIKQSSLNAVINQSGTHPLTGLTKTASGRTRDLTNDEDFVLSTIDDLDPMVNPVERVRIISLDFENNRVVCQSVHLQNDLTTSATIENHPKGQGLLFDHADGTPIWLVLGNADLIIDDGNKDISSVYIGVPATVDTIVGGSGYTAASNVATTGGSGTGLTVNTTVSSGAITAITINATGSGYEVDDTITVTGGTGGTFDIASLAETQYTRPKDAFTRARFTQGQRFEDKSGNNNTAYFVASQSRIPSSIGTSPSTSQATDPEPPNLDGDLVLWLPVSALTGYSDDDTVTHLPDLSGNKFGVYTVGTWKYQAQSANFNSRPSLKITSTDGALVNIDTDDGESEEMSHTLSTDGFTAFFMVYNPTFSNSGPFDLIGENASTSKTFFGQGTDADDFILTNYGLTSTYTATNASLNRAGLLIVEFNLSNDDLFLYQDNELKHTALGNAQIQYRFDNRLFALFGRALTTNTSTKTGTASNKAPQDFEVAEVLLYERVLTTSERQQVQGYFLNKFGVI
jgi:hypothetical protein